MRTLLYKQTHTGDPNPQGIFGCRDCMRSVRSWDFDAVIGVGGQGSEAISKEIDRKVTWIGIGTHKSFVSYLDYPMVTFDNYYSFGTDGPELSTVAPHLARLMYDRKARAVMTFNLHEQSEISKLLKLASDAPKSQARDYSLERLSNLVCKPETDSTTQCDPIC